MATVIPRKPLRVPKGNSAPIPAPTPLEDEEDGPQPAASPVSATLEDEDEDEPGIPVGTVLRDAAKARMEARKLPPIPPNVTFEEWQRYFAPLSEEQKSHIICYWYRLKPVIDRRMIDPTRTKYIDCVATAEQMTYEYMLNNHGGGVYQCIVNDTDIRKGGQLTQIKLEIPMSQHDPVIDLEELDLTHKENQVFVNKLKAKGLITSDGRINKNPTAEAKKEESMSNAIVSRLLDNVLESKKAAPAPAPDTGLSTLLVEMMKQNNPSAQLATLLAVVDKLKPTEAPKQDSALEYLKLMELQRANYDTKIAALQEKIMELATRPAPTAEKPDIASEIEKIKSMAEALGMNTGGGGKVHWIDRLIETVGPAIPGIVQIISSRLASPGQTPGNPGIPRMPNDLDMPNQQPNPQPGQPAGLIEGEMNFLDTVIQTAGNDFITAIANGVSGAEAAESVINLRGMPIYRMIVKDGVQGIAEAIKRNPAFAQQLARITTEEKLTVWLTEFVELDSEGTDEDEDLAQMPAVAAKKAKKVN